MNSATAVRAPAPDQAALAACVGDLADFTAHVWGTSTRRYRGREICAQLLDVADIDELLSSAVIRPWAIRVVYEQRVVPIMRYMDSPLAHTGHHNDSSFDYERFASLAYEGVVDPRKVLELMDRGASLILQASQRYQPAIAHLARRLELALGHRSHVNIYLSPPNSQAFGVHHDLHDVFILQIAGSKQWSVGPTPAEAAAGADATLAPTTLSAGDVFYLPAGTPHEVRSRDDWSVHVTIGITALQPRDIIRAQLHTALDALLDSQPDQRLPVGWHWQPDPHEDRLRQLWAAASDQVADQAPDRLAATAALGFESERRRLAPSGLRGRMALPLKPEQELAVPAIVPFAVHWTGDGEAVLALGDHSLPIPAERREAVCRIAEQRRCRPIDLADTLPLDAALQLCAELVRAGALTPADALLPADGLVPADGLGQVSEPSAVA